MPLSGSTAIVSAVRVAAAPVATVRSGTAAAPAERGLRGPAEVAGRGVAVVRAFDIARIDDVVERHRHRRRVAARAPAAGR